MQKKITQVFKPRDQAHKILLQGHSTRRHGALSETHFEVYQERKYPYGRALPEAR